MIHVKPHISKMATYAPPWTNMDRAEYLRLDLNENTLNPPTHVKDALKRYVNDNRIQMYPDYFAFLSKLAQYAGVDRDRLIVTNGSDQAIEIILRSFLGVGDTVVMAQPGFPMFTQIAGVIGANVKGIPYDSNMNFPCDEFVDAIREEKPQLVVIVNPDNPTGASVRLPFIEKVLDLVPHTPVIVDEAYYEFTNITAIGFLDSHPNMIVTRTFSKAFAMAGLRLGYTIAHPDIITEFHKVRGPFDVNSCALVAAEAQMDSPDEWMAFVHETMSVSKPRLERFFDDHGVTHFSGAANFMLVQPKDRDGAVRHLKTNGILVRPMTAPAIDQTFRMNVGTARQMERFVAVWQKMPLSIR